MTIEIVDLPIENGDLPTYTEYHLVGGAINILKNDGVRQWEGWHPIYEMEDKIHVWNHQTYMICYLVAHPTARFCGL